MDAKFTKSSFHLLCMRSLSLWTDQFCLPLLSFINYRYISFCWTGVFGWHGNKIWTGKYIWNLSEWLGQFSVSLEIYCTQRNVRSSCSDIRWKYWNNRNSDKFSAKIHRFIRNIDFIGICFSQSASVLAAQNALEQKTAQKMALICFSLRKSWYNNVWVDTVAVVRSWR